MIINKRSAEKTVRDIRRRTRKEYSAEEKIRVVIEGLRGEESIVELCRKEGLSTNVCYRWSRVFCLAYHAHVLCTDSSCHSTITYAYHQ